MDDNELHRRLYVPNFDHWKRLSNKKYFSDREPTVKTIERGIILPPKEKEIKDKYRYRGGVCDQDLNFVAGYSSLSPNKLNGWCCIDEAYSIDRSELEQSDEEVIWGGALICHFGHFITECLSRMWYVVEHPEDRRKIIFERLNTWKVERWIYDFFELLGLTEDRIEILETPTQFRAVIVPEQSVRIKHNYTSKFLLPFRKMVERAPKSEPKKIFLTRSKDLHSQMYLANADYFEEFYRSKGFEIVAPEKLSAAEQISLIGNAEEIATHLGTLAHWSLFSRAGAKWTMLTRVDNFTSRQCLINDAVGIDWCIVSTSMNFMVSDQGGGVCLLGPTEHWKNFVRDRFGETLSIDSKVPKEVFDDYVDHWCRYFVKPEHFDKRVKTLQLLYSRMSTLEMRLKLDRPVLCYQTHVAVKGWLPSNVEGDVAGTLDQKKSLQAIRIFFDEPFVDVSYSVFYPKEGWTEPVSNKQTAGVTGKNKAIYGLSISLDQSTSDQKTPLDVIYRVHNFNGEWSPWAMSGARLNSLEYELDAVQIKLIERRVER